jgi:hypothetical protein
MASMVIYKLRAVGGSGPRRAFGSETKKKKKKNFGDEHHLNQGDEI